jgi:hypothetical protein
MVGVKFGDISAECTFSTRESVFTVIEISYPWCVATSCVSEWESGDNQMSDEFVKAYEIWSSFNVANSYEADDDDVECKISSLSTSDKCIADYLNTPYPAFEDALQKCESLRIEVADNTIIFNYDDCNVSLLTDECAADGGKFELDCIIILIFFTHLI